MDCENPMLAMRQPDGKYKFIRSVRSDIYMRNASGVGERKFYFDVSGEFILLPCGQCTSCRLNKSRDWATRCVLEAKMHKENCFITLTYNDEYLPSDLSLRKKDFTDFIKRLRKNTDCKIRYFAAGEYGELHQRPHYHACLFGWRPDDLKLYTIRNGISLYQSESLLKAWQYKGFVTVGDVTFESAAYVARYVMKKVYGPSADEHYDGRQPEYTVMSRRPGIAATFFEKYSTDIYGKDFIVIRDGIKCKPPKYFDRIFDDYYGDGMFEACVKPCRIYKARMQFLNSEGTEFTFKRIVRRAEVKKLRFKQRMSFRSLDEVI